MIYKNKHTGEEVTRKTMLKTMFESYGNENPDELAITEHFVLILPYFRMGNTVITRTLDAAINENPEAQAELMQCYERYRICDWGDSSINDQEENDQAILKADRRILASYKLKSIGREIWIITEWDRSATTFLFPEDY